jgi:hypothetical protein
MDWADAYEWAWDLGAELQRYSFIRMDVQN